MAKTKDTIADESKTGASAGASGEGAQNNSGAENTAKESDAVKQTAPPMPPEAETESGATAKVISLLQTFPAIFPGLLNDHLTAYNLQTITIPELESLKANQRSEDGSASPAALTDAEKETIAIQFMQSHPEMQGLLDQRKVDVRMAQMQLNNTPSNQYQPEDMIDAQKGNQKGRFSKMEWENMGKDKAGWKKVVAEPKEVADLKARNAQ